MFFFITLWPKKERSKMADGYYKCHKYKKQRNAIPYFRNSQKNAVSGTFRNVTTTTTTPTPTLVNVPGDVLPNIAAFEGTNLLSKTFANARHQLGHRGAVLFPRHANIDAIMAIAPEKLEGLQGYKIMNFDTEIASRLQEFVQLPSVKNWTIEFHMVHMEEQFGTGGGSYETNRVNIAMKNMVDVLREAPYLENLTVVMYHPQPHRPSVSRRLNFDPSPSPWQWHNYNLSRIGERERRLTSFHIGYRDEPDPTR
jgi:hypothetical protein